MSTISWNHNFEFNQQNLVRQASRPGSCRTLPASSPKNRKSDCHDKPMIGASTLVNTSPLKRISDVVCFSKDQRCHGPKATLIEPSGFGPLYAASQTPKNRWHEESTGTIETPMHPNLASCKDGQQRSSTCFACGRCIVNMSWCLFDTASKGFLLSGIDAGFKLQTITTWNCHWLSQASMAYMAFWELRTLFIQENSAVFCFDGPSSKCLFLLPREKTCFLVLDKLYTVLATAKNASAPTLQSPTLVRDHVPVAICRASTWWRCCWWACHDSIWWYDMCVTTLQASSDSS